MAIGSYLDIICEVFNNQGITRLIDLNGEHFKGITDYPYLTHGDVESQDLEKLGAFLTAATGSGVLIPDEGIEDYVREAAGFPERIQDYGTRLNQPQNPAQRATGGTAAGKQPSGKEEPPEDDEEAVKAAKRRLGRDD